MKAVIMVAYLLLWLHPLYGQTPKDSAAIRATALDYVEGWYDGNALRMEKAVHPQLAKRIVGWSSEKGNNSNVLQDMNAGKLIENTRKGFGTKTARELQTKNVMILDIYNNTASVKVEMKDWIDYVHMARWNGEWKIINVLWEMKPQE